MRSFQLWVGVVVAGVGCGGEAPGTETDTPSPPTGVISVDIVASEGGSVEGGGGTLVVAPGALSEDTTLTLEVLDPGALPDAASVVGQAFDFGPDGTTFLTAATLTLPLDTEPGPGERAVISWLDGSTWVDLPSTAGAGEVVAPVEHFTTFVIRLVPGATFDCSFGACVGSVTDIEWNLVGSCFDPVILPPFCAESTVTHDAISATGRYFLDSATGRYEFQVTQVGSLTYEIPASCLSGLASCDDLDNPADGYDCGGDATTSCSCTVTVNMTGGDSGAFEVNGSEIRSLKDGEAEWESGPYCATDTELKIPTSGLLLVFERP